MGNQEDCLRKRYEREAFTIIKGNQNHIERFILGILQAKNNSIGQSVKNSSHLKRIQEQG